MAEAEKVLCAFGPFGVSVCNGPYGVFKWQKTNMTRIELTDTCIRAVIQRAFGPFGRWRSRKGPFFEIPYASLVAVRLLPHPARLGLQQVLDIVYREGEVTREVSIAAYNAPARRAFAVLLRHAPTGPAGP
jgi:hypothetical protein